jgi:hypothetical protein
MMFAAIGLMGVVGYSASQYMRGPLVSATALTRVNVAQTEMGIASQMAVMASAQQSSSGDCDSDGLVEPLAYKTGTLNSPVGGGYLPDTIGGAKQDPWGTPYGYCVWDHGAMTLQASCQTSGADNRLAGGNILTQPILVMVSAGPNGTFQTTCRAWIDANADGVPDLALVDKTGDDIVINYTYADANQMSGDLWNLKSGAPGTATIAKSLEVAGGANFAGSVSFSGGSIILPDQLTSGACNSANANQLRRNMSTSPPGLEICVNDGSPNWDAVSAGSGGSGTPGGADTQVQFNDASAFNGDSAFIWNKTTNRLGINTPSSPLAAVDLGSTIGNGGGGGGGGGGPITVHQVSTANTNFTSGFDTTTTSFSSLPSAGDAVIVAIGVWGDLNGHPLVVTDNQGNSYSLVTEHLIGGGAMTGSYIYAAYNIGAPSGTFTITVVVPEYSEIAGVQAYAVSGLASNSGAVDQTGHQDQSFTGQTSLTATTAGSTTDTEEFALAVHTNIFFNDPAFQYTISGGWTNAYTWDTNCWDYVCTSMVYKITSAAGSVAHTWSYPSQDANWDEGAAAVIATFKGGDGGGTAQGQKLLAYGSTNTRAGLGWNMVSSSGLEADIFAPSNGSAGNINFGFVSNSDGSTYTEKMRLKENGYLGVGTTTPEAMMQIAGELMLGNTSLGCTGTTEGAIRYNATSDILQLCDGTSWGSVSSGGGGGGATPAGSDGQVQFNDNGALGADTNFVWNKTSDWLAIGQTTAVVALDINGSAIIGTDSSSCSGILEGTIRFNTTTLVHELCNGTTWLEILSSKDSGVATTPTTGTGYFVLTETTWNGNLVWLSGADTKCLTELQTTYDWMGKTDANSRGMLVSGNVKAFLCGHTPGATGSGCNNLIPGATYTFARANKTTVGGATFTADKNGLGPNNNQMWSGTNYFGGAFAYWTGRDTTSDTKWVEQSTGNNGSEYCGAASAPYEWSSNSGSVYGVAGYSNSNNSQRIWFSYTPCSSSLRLICMVHPL